MNHSPNDPRVRSIMESIELVFDSLERDPHLTSWLVGSCIFGDRNDERRFDGWEVDDIRQVVLAYVTAIPEVALEAVFDSMERMRQTLEKFEADERIECLPLTWEARRRAGYSRCSGVTERAATAGGAA